MKTSLVRLAPALAALLLAACGSSSSSPEATVTVTGSVYAAPIAGASVVAQDGAGAAVSAAVTTAADGTFTLQVPQSKAAGALVIAAGGGTFTDEATGSATAGGALRAFVAAGGLSSGGAVHLTPASTMVATMIGHGFDLATANAAMEAAFGFTADTSVAPQNAPVAAGASTAPALAALRAGAFSQLAKDLGVPAASQFSLFHELAHDAMDGVLDGADEGAPLQVGAVVLPEDVQNRFTAALLTWRAAPGNLTVLNVGQVGAPPFGAVALSASYRVQYTEVMQAMVGKHTFQLNVTDKATGLPVEGAAVSIMPMMHMATKNHSAPIDPIVEAGAGLYDCEVYWVMASGPDMGVWELKVMVNGEAVTIYPHVGMSMGDTTMARLTGGAADQIAGMPAAVARTYQLFSEGLSYADGAGSFGLMVSTMDTMMSFPHAVAGATFHDGTTAPVTVAAVQVRVSADGGQSWAVAADVGNGHYVASGLAGVTLGVQAALRVELSVDLGAGPVVKKTQDLSADYATFNVTPGAM